MKRPKSIEERSELLDFASSTAYGLFAGGMLASFLPSWSYVVFGAFSAVFGILNWRTGFASTKARQADRLDALRYRGIYPAPGQGTDEDVRRLNTAGERHLAMQLYRELHGSSLRESLDFVDAL